MSRPARALGFCLLLLTLTVAVAGRADVTTPAADWLARHVERLASPAMEGRLSGTAGGDRAAAYLAEALASYGLRPGGDGSTFLQSFVLSAGTRLADENVLRVEGAAAGAEAGREWMPHGGSPEADLVAPVVFAGHGVVIADGGHDDYAGRDVRGRIVVVEAGTPAALEGARASRLEKLIAARERGAAAVLLVEDTLPTLRATSTRVDLPSASVTPTVAHALRSRAAPTGRLRIALVSEPRRAANVVGVVPGTDPARAGEAVVIGAHYDHLGAGDALYAGADDNASGTAVVLGLARAFAAAGGAPRTLVFALFGAEELGLFGSRHYVANPVVPLAGTVAMLNFDMVGRLRDDRLHVGGVDSGTTLRPLVADAARAEGLALDARGAPHAPSDHMRFYETGTPVLFFYTGAHADYHRPTDTADRINAVGMARIAAMASRVVARLAGAPRPA
ncbi:MAG: M28 family peptidase, partial [Candidatus Rokuibacteriota bacterium]